MTSDVQTGDSQDNSDTTSASDTSGSTDSSDSGTSTDNSSSASSGTGQDASSGDGSSGSNGSGDSSASGSNGSGNGSDSGAGSDSSSDTGSSGDTSASPSGDSTTASSDQTPADQLVVNDIQPVSVSPDGSGASAPASQGTQAASPSGDDAVAADASSGIGGSGVSVGDLVTIGKAVASIMTASSPDYSMKSNPVSVLPQGKDPTNLTGVSADPQELRLVVAMDNKLGMEMCNLPIVVQWRYGGSLGGKGHYITNASAFLDSGADIGAFYKGDVNATLDNPFNAGSDASDPIASVDVHIEVKVTDKISPANLFVVLEGNIRGDGYGKLARRPN